ncbi:MAG: hypothetical protein GF317_00740 [Candidatus Lokiarchaeota archaeon]|nr:hypothetical protein [Candidatus Lokiarchaeota archaeon]
MKEHLEIIEINKDKPDFYEKKNLEKMRWFGTEKKLEKHIIKTLPKFKKMLD